MYHGDKCIHALTKLCGTLKGKGGKSDTCTLRLTPCYEESLDGGALPVRLHAHRQTGHLPRQHHTGDGHQAERHQVQVLEQRRDGGTQRLQ